MATVVDIKVLVVENITSIKVVILKGQVDESNLKDLSNVLDKLVEDKDTKYIVLNLKELEFMNSKVVGYLASLYSSLAEQGKKLVIVEANETILDILSLVGLTSIIENYTSLEEAIEVIKTDIEEES